MPKEVKSHSSRRSRSRSPMKHKPQRRRSTSRRRSRSRSPKKHRNDSRRSRSRSPRKHRSQRRRSSSRDNTKGGAVPKYLMDRPQITEKDLEGKSEEEQQMMKLMGFGNFDTTKGKHVPGNDVYAVHVVQKRKYRQYMNRKGGFNRPLDFVA